MDHTSGVIAKKYLPNPSHKSLILLFFRSFIVLDFLFRSVIHFELIFVYIEKYGLKFIFFFLAYGYLIVAALFVEKKSFLHNCLFTDTENQLSVYVLV